MKRRTKDEILKWKANILACSFRMHGVKKSRKDCRDLLSKNNICPYCKEIIKIKDVSIDRILPRTRGGENVENNLQLVCWSCNKMKGEFTDDEFKKLLNFSEEFPLFYKILKKRLKASGMIYR